MVKLKNSLLFYFVFVNAYYQKDLFSHSPIIIKHVVLDTLETKLNSTVMHILWLNDTIKVGIQNKKIKIDSAHVFRYRKVFRDSTLWRNQQNINNLILSIKTGAQNCYTYAFEKYFDNNKTFSQDLFGKYTSIDQESARKILNSYFKKIEEFSTRSIKNLKKIIPNDVLLAFIDKND